MLVPRRPFRRRSNIARVMSPRKTILRELSQKGAGAFARPSDIQGFQSNAPKFREAVNVLLKEQLISGAQDDTGKLVVTINEQNASRVRRELRPWFARPLVWGTAMGIAALATLGLFG